MLRAGGVYGSASAFLERGYQILDRTSLLSVIVVPRAEHLQESPLGPLVVGRIAGAKLTAPIVGETDPVHLLTVTVDVVDRRHLRMLPGLNGVLLGRKAESVVPHRVKHIEALESLVAGIYVAGDVAQRMADVQTCSGRIREHIQNIELRLGRILLRLESAVLGPVGLPLFLNFPEIVVHFITVVY